MASKKLTSKQKRTIMKALSNHKVLWTLFIILMILVIAFCVFYFAFPTQFKNVWDKLFGKEQLPDISAPDGHLAVHFLDVGQGDCIIIELPDGKNMIIDAGGNGNNTYGKSPESLILDKIKALGITTFDYMILTHTDADHVDYMDSVIYATEVKNIYRPAFLSEKEAEENPNSKFITVDTKTYGNFVKAVDEEIKNSGAKEYFNIKGVEPIVGEGYRMDFYAVGEEYYRKDGPISSNEAYMKNFVSPMCLLRFGSEKERRVLFTGDAEGKGGNDAEQYFLDTLKEERLEIDIDVLKVGHHGSSSSASNDLLYALDPEYAVISVGTNKDHGHPTLECLDRLNNYSQKDNDGNADDITTLMTKDSGDIVMRVDPSGNMSVLPTSEEENKEDNKKVVNYNIFVCEYNYKESFAI